MKEGARARVGAARKAKRERLLPYKAPAEPEGPEEPEIDTGERKKWEQDLSQIRTRVEAEFKPFTELQWQIALRLMYGMSEKAIVDELGIAYNTVARLRNMAKFEALAASFGKHHLVVAGYNARVELRRRTTSKKVREALPVKDLISIDKAAGVLAGPMHVKPSGPQVQIFLHPGGAAEAAQNPTLAGIVVQALPAPGEEENGKFD
ncbi:MAG: hypothetical protein WBC82_01355 [Dehalococcoidia bacterium]